MSLIVKPNTFTVGAIIIASEHNANFDTIYNDYNGNIDNNNIKSTAGIVDTKLAQISTAGKVTGDALTQLANIPAGAGDIPEANLDGNAVVLTGAQTIAGVKTFSSIPVLPASNPTADNEAVRKAYVDADFRGYGTSTSSYSSIDLGGLKICWGQATLSSGNATITNLPFTSGTSYTAVATRHQAADVSQAIQITSQSASSFGLRDSLASAHVANWIAIGS